MRKAKSEARYTKGGQRLRPGETEKIKGGEVVGYEYRKQIRGKRHTIFATSLRELREKEDELTGYIRDGIQTGNITLNEIYARWLDGKRSVRDTTLGNYKYMLDTFAMPVLGSTPVKRIKPSDVLQMYEGFRERGLAVNTVDNIHTPLSQIFDMAVFDGVIYRNPCNGVISQLRANYRQAQEDPDAEDDGGRHPLTILQQDNFEKYLTNSKWSEKWAPIFITELYTGMRCGEICGLQWGDVDFAGNCIWVKHNLVYLDKRRPGTGGGCDFAMHPTKSKAGRRRIPMTALVAETLKQHRERTQHVKCTRPVGKYSDFVFLNRAGAPYNQAPLNDALRRIVLAYNGEVLNRDKWTDADMLPHITTHIFRHTFCSRLVEADVPVKTAQKVMGHEDIRTTMDIYADVDDSITQQAIAVDFVQQFEEVRRQQLAAVRAVAEGAEDE